ncbi:Transport and Golgi organization protein 2 [Madurella mycetomatis]|uniref:Transport and Golgi organization protein 2 n=1 Tax=Madurella mycetomatis TaxID=100816 RepID=A0A175W2Y9_9PEZI|nr:Transport and Golgi organization protein 2 [Madurella mycetomatis]
MCIVLVTTAHPKYALIVLDNRDEFILRPTSRPHWWTATPETHIANGLAKGLNGPGPTGQPSDIHVLSSRDLQRAEQGTWLGITKGGNFAVLTNYREMDTQDAAHPVRGKRSRGGMVTAWLRADPAESTAHFVHRMLEDGGVKGVGGFSLMCGKLRKVKGEKNVEPLAIISNRCDHAGQVPWICGQRGTAYGLSNATYLEPSAENSASVWPKIRDGISMLNDAVASASGSESTEKDLINSLFKILDVDNFPADHTINLEEGISLLKDSIFIPAFGGKEHQKEMNEARRRGSVKERGHNSPGDETLTTVGRPDDQLNGFQTGLYGTQRQTVILVDWDGNVTYTERALWDPNGNPIQRGSGDETFRFKIDGWESGSAPRNHAML